MVDSRCLCNHTPAILAPGTYWQAHMSILAALWFTTWPIIIPRHVTRQGIAKGPLFSACLARKQYTLLRLASLNSDDVGATS